MWSGAAPFGKARMAAPGTKRNCLGEYGNFRSWGQTGRTINLATTAALDPIPDISIRHCAHQGGSISPLMIFTTCDASANSVAAIAKVTLTRLSLGRSSSIDNFCGVKPTRRNRK